MGNLSVNQLEKELKFLFAYRFDCIEDLSAKVEPLTNKLISEVKRLQAIEADYIALQEIMDRARKLAFMQVEEEEQGPRFRMNADGNLERINQ